MCSRMKINRVTTSATTTNKYNNIIFLVRYVVKIIKFKRIMTTFWKSVNILCVSIFGMVRIQLMIKTEDVMEWWIIFQDSEEMRGFSFSEKFKTKLSCKMVLHYIRKQLTWNVVLCKIYFLEILDYFYRSSWWQRIHSFIITILSLYYSSTSSTIIYKKN